LNSSHRNLNILIITPRIPYPPYRGDKLKVFNIGKELIKNNSVTILTFLRNRQQLEDIEELKKQKLNVIFVKISLFESCLNVLKSIFTHLPFQVAWYKSNGMKKKVNDLIDSGNYDVAYFHLIRTAQYIPEQKVKSSVLKVVDFTDAVSLYLNRFYTIEKNPIKKILLGIEKKRIEKYERVANKFDVVFICSEVDRDYLKRQGVKANIKIIRNGVDVQQFTPEKIDYDKNRIIFTGNMPYYANYDAAIYFSKEIFPLVLREVPEAKFFIVGQNPPFRVRSLANQNIIVTGFVQDIKAEYLKSAVNVAPMRFGAGTLNKIIESLVIGVPVIATPIAIEGFPDELKKIINVASDSDEFAKQVIRFLKETELRNQFMALDKSVIKEMLSWENVVSQFENDLIDELKKVK
jgi:sugar transferase (PEP-CTERM/EpsH1 system associated)